MKPDVSIIIPTYNRGDLLLETIESCVRQERVSTEIIVVDDGSTDGSVQLAKEKYPKLKLIKQENGGACRARNSGLAASSGKFIKFLDSDDLLAPNLLASQIKAIVDTDADVVYGDFEMFGALNDSRVGGKPQRIVGNVIDPVDALLGDWWCAPFCYLYRSLSLLGLRWNPELSCLQDFDFILRIALSGARFSYLPGICGSYRMHHGQITNHGAEVYARNRCLILDETVTLLEQNGCLTELRKSLLAHGYWTAARAFYRTDVQQFECIVAKIEQLCPKFAPKFWGPLSIRLLTKYWGIRNAEKVLEFYRKSCR